MPCSTTASGRPRRGCWRRRPTAPACTSPMPSSARPSTRARPRPGGAPGTAGRAWRWPPPPAPTPTRWPTSSSGQATRARPSGSSAPACGRAPAAASLTAAARFVAAAGLLADDAARAGERGWLLFLGARLLAFVDTDAALRHLAAADALARAAADPVLAAHLHGTRGTALCHRPLEYSAGIAELERGVAAIEALPPEYRRWSPEEVALARVGALLPEQERATLPARGRDLPVALHQGAASRTSTASPARYRDARALGEATVAAALADDPGQRDVQRFGLAHAYAALGAPDAARREYGLWRATCYANNVLYVVEYTTWAELRHAVLPYQADDLAERARLVAESARAWSGAQGTVATPYPSQAGLPVAVLEGRWAEARRLAEAADAVATIGHAQGAGATLGMLARQQGEPEAAWARVRALHPAGPETAPGDCHFAPRPRAAGPRGGAGPRRGRPGDGRPLDRGARALAGLERRGPLAGRTPAPRLRAPRSASGRPPRCPRTRRTGARPRPRTAPAARPPRRPPPPRRTGYGRGQVPRRSGTPCPVLRAG